jgi:trans-aconitate methyltransferase
MDRVKEIEEVFQKYGTEKRHMGYEPLYAEIDKTTIKTILEIGVSAGQSLVTWLELFPYAQICGIDIGTFDQNINHWPKVNGHPIFSSSLLEHPKVKIIDKQNILTFNVESLSTTFDLIVDDASHIPEEQVATFKKLWPFLNKDGWYVIEDVYLLKRQEPLLKLVDVDIFETLTKYGVSDLRDIVTNETFTGRLIVARK